MPDWMLVAVRTFAAILALLVVTRLLGKRQITELSVFEYITGITLGSLAAYVSIDMQENWYLGFVALIVWAGMSLLIEFLQLKSKWFRDLVDGRSTVLIKEGKVMEDNLKKERLTIDELLQQLRKKNVFKLSDVEFAVMEPTGEINVMLRKEHQPLTASHLGVRVGPEREPQTVIMDGNILDEPLATMGLNRDWLLAELEKQGVAPENVFVAQVDAYGQLYVDVYDDQLKLPEPQQKASLFATLKKCEADLEMFSLSSEQESAKQLYGECAQQLKNVISDLEPLLTR